MIDQKVLEIGNLFNYEGVTFEVVEHLGCEGCYFDTGHGCSDYVNVSCSTSKPDGKPVIFKKRNITLELLTKAHEELVRCGIESEIVDEIKYYLNKTKYPLYGTIAQYAQIFNPYPRNNEKSNL